MYCSVSHSSPGGVLKYARWMVRDFLDCFCVILLSKDRWRGSFCADISWLACHGHFFLLWLVVKIAKQKSLSLLDAQQVLVNLPNWALKSCWDTLHKINRSLFTMSFLMSFRIWLTFCRLSPPHFLSSVRMGKKLSWKGQSFWRTKKKGGNGS